MKDWLERVFASWFSAVLIACALFCPKTSSAQDLPPSDEIPFIDDFEIPKTEPGDLVLPDESLAVSDAEAQRFGNAMLSEPGKEKVYRDVLRLENGLKAHVEKIIPKLGRERVMEIKKWLNSPESSKERAYHLRKLNASEFMKIPSWDSEAGFQAIGEVLFLERVNRGGNWVDDFRVVIPGVGFAEPKLVGGKLYPRMVDEATGSSHFFLESELEVESPEWRRYNARVRAWANRGKGRPQVYWVLHHPEIQGSPESGSVRIRYFGRPEGIRNRLTNWWKACYVKPDKQAFVQAGIKMFFEVGTAGLMHLAAPGVVDQTFIGLTLGYSSVLGLYGSTVRNALAPVDPTNFIERTYKMALRLLVTSYSFGASSRALQDGISSVSWFTPTGRALNFEILKNSLVSNVLRDGVNSLSDVREATGHARYVIDPNGLKLKGTQFERTLFYQVPNAIKNLDLVTLGTARNALPHFLFYSSIVAIPVAVWKHAQAIRYEHAEDLPAARVIRFFREAGGAISLMAMNPRVFTPLIAKVLGSYAQDAFMNCKVFLTRLKSGSEEEEPLPESPFAAQASDEWVEVRLHK